LLAYHIFYTTAANKYQAVAHTCYTVNTHTLLLVKQSKRVHKK